MDTYNNYYDMADRALSVLINDKYDEETPKDYVNQAIDKMKRLKEKMIQGNNLWQRKEYNLCLELFKRLKDDCFFEFNQAINVSKDSQHTQLYIDEFRKYIRFIVEIVKAKLEEIENNKERNS